jgi:tRNA:m4X modification enzyme
VKLAFPAAALVMIERSGVKFKSDKWLRKMEMESNANADADAEASSSLSSSAPSFRRLRMDLRHLYIQGLGLPADGRLAFVGKHVCGVATDLSLRAVAAFLRERASSTSSPLPAVGVGIACCCYHVCRWDDYVGKEVWEEEFGWGRAQFEVVQRCACWVSSSYGELNRQEEGRREGEEEVVVVAAAGVMEAPEHDVPEEAEGGGYGRGLSVEEKLAMGRVCKRLIDYGRLEYLRRACGLEGEIVAYCEPSVSPENTCILAWTATAAKTSSE